MKCTYVPACLRVCLRGYVPPGTFHSLPSSVCPSGPLLVASPPPIPGRQHPCPVKYPRPHYNLRPDSRLLLDCNTFLSLSLACCSFWALHAPALLPLIPSLPRTNRLLLSTPLKSSKSHARSLFTIRPRNTHPLAVHHARLEITCRHGAPHNSPTGPIPPTCDTGIISLGIVAGTTSSARPLSAPRCTSRARIRIAFLSPRS